MKEAKIYSVLDGVCDFTGWKGVCGNRADWEKLFNHYCEQIEVIGGLKPGYVLFGTRTCDIMLQNFNRREFLWRIKYACEHDMKVNIVIPQLHQKNRTAVLLFLEWIFNSICVNSVQVNDIGGGMLIRKYFGENIQIYAGRLFDKTMRENRLDIMTIEKISKNSELLRKTQFADFEYRKLFEEFGICRAELDTLPDGELILPEGEISWDVIYPRIMLSLSANCLYQQCCDKGCAVYRKKFFSRGRVFFIDENGVFCIKQSELQKSVRGKFRLIYSE